MVCQTNILPPSIGSPGLVAPSRRLPLCPRASFSTCHRAASSHRWAPTRRPKASSSSCRRTSYSSCPPAPSSCRPTTSSSYRGRPASSSFPSPSWPATRPPPTLPSQSPPPASSRRRQSLSPPPFPGGAPIVLLRRPVVVIVIAVLAVRRTAGTDAWSEEARVLSSSSSVGLFVESSLVSTSALKPTAFGGGLPSACCILYSRRRREVPVIVWRPRSLIPAIIR